GRPAPCLLSSSPVTMFTSQLILISFQTPPSSVIYALSLHDALPILGFGNREHACGETGAGGKAGLPGRHDAGGCRSDVGRHLGRQRGRDGGGLAADDAPELL